MFDILIRDIMESRHIFIPEFALGTGRFGQEELKWLETLKGYKVKPVTTEPEFERVSSKFADLSSPRRVE